MKKKGILLIGIFLLMRMGFAQSLNEILGSPTDNSIIISVLADSDTEIYWEYGSRPGELKQATLKQQILKDKPAEFKIDGLQQNTRYFYRTRYRTAGSGAAFQTGQEQSFQTARPQGSVFSFAIEADPHLDMNSQPEAYSLTLRNILSKSPDFMIDLGDNFMSEKEPVKNQQTITARHLLYRPYYGSICHSVPLFLVLGNHEGEVGWSLNGTATSNPVLMANTRKLYYPNPVPDGFYSGNTKEEPFVGLRENYYAFKWSDALIIVLDPFWYTLKKSDWNFTLGTDQYNWFKKTLSESKSKYKFVFCHHLVGGYTSDARGGAEYADFYEMGGKNADGTFGFGSWRPGWQKPIHTLMKEYGVTAFFHGHDHFYGKQEKDGVIYQVVPQPSNKNITNVQASAYGYINGVFLPGRGFLQVTVSPENVRVDYIRTYLPSEENATLKNGEVAYSYTVKPVTTGTSLNLSPDKTYIEQSFPNPFSESTSFNYKINCRANVQLSITDLMGKQVARLVNQEQPEGFYTTTFNAGNLHLSPGIYIAQFTAGTYKKSIRLIYSKL